MGVFVEAFVAADGGGEVGCWEGCCWVHQAKLGEDVG
jgi:hypothetical protein